MSDVPSPDLRVGDDDRESALSALGEHMSAGRIDIDEYGERSAKVAAAKTRGELAEVFTDLPAPHPAFGATTAAKPSQPAAEVQPARSGSVTHDDRPVAQRIAAALVPLGFIGAFVLFFTVGGWWWFALPFVILAMGQGIWGKDWEKDVRGRDRRDARRQDRHHDRHGRHDGRDHRRDDRDWRRS